MSQQQVPFIIPDAELTTEVVHAAFEGLAPRYPLNFNAKGHLPCSFRAQSANS